MNIREKLLITLGVVLGATTPSLAQEAIQPEQVQVTTVPQSAPRVYMVDIAIGHIVDGRLHVLDGNTLAYLGLVGTGFGGHVYVPPKGEAIYVATTYLSRLNRGDRSDFLEVYDPATLSFKEEIPISTKRAQAVNYRPLMWGSADGRWMFIQNATPATSFSVVDLRAKKMTAEVPTPGCYGVYPLAKDSLRFATLCGDGTIPIYTLAQDGSGATRKASPRLFDPDEDALFSHGERDGDGFLFVSFTGNVYRIDLSGEAARLGEKIPLTQGIEGGWRPGGYQPFAYDQASGMLYVLMHSNGDEGSHKNPAEEIWSFDLKAKKVTARSPTKTTVSLTSAPDGSALYAINPIDLTLIRYTADKSKGYALMEAQVENVGETATQLEAR